MKIFDQKSSRSRTFPKPLDLNIGAMNYQQYSFHLPEQLEYDVQEAMAQLGVKDFFIESFVGQDSVLKVFIPKLDSADLAAIRAVEKLGCEQLEVKDVAEADWLKAWMDTLEPFLLSDGVWVNPFPDRQFTPPEGCIALKLVPGSAFGTGLHATTRLAAKVLDQLDLKQKSIVDVGCGTGILALLAKFRGAKHLLCLDDDPVAIEKVHLTFGDNQLGSVEAEVSDLLDAVKAGANFDILVANIITEVLEALLEHPRFMDVCRDDTEIVFSGISNAKRERMEASFKLHPVRVLSHHSEGDWNSYHLRIVTTS
jgi:ribosomal protein L11 methyltransferase